METIGLMSEQLMCQNPLALQQLKRIWRECFEADDGYLDAYFSIGYRPEQTLVFQDDDTVLGMLTLLPCQYRGIHQGKVRLYKAAYLFAVGTLPQAQGRQIASKLLGAADDVLKKQGVELALLAPAEPSLYHFYQKRGYESFFTRRELFFEPKGRAEHPNTRTLSLKPVSLSEYYPKHINRIPQESILWDEQTLCFAERESILYGGGLYVLMDGQNELCICNIYRYKAVSYTHLVGFSGLGFFQSDNAVSGNFFHSFCNQVTDYFIAAGNGSNSCDVSRAVYLLGVCNNSFYSGVNCFLDTFFEYHWVCTSSNVLHTFANQSLSKQGSGGGTVTSSIVCLGCNFFYQLCAHVFKWVRQFDFFCDGNTVVCDQWCTEFFVKNNIASFWTKGDFNGISQLVNTSL